MTKTDNRTNGGRFEQELSHILAENGFWVHVMQQNKAGQPADIIAVKGRYHTLIDCKLISDDKGFPFSRIEDNQKYAMRTFMKKCREACWFALKLPDGSIWMVTEGKLQTLKYHGNSKITDSEIRKQTWPLEKWLRSSDVWAEDV